MTDAEWHDYFAGWKNRMGWSTNKIAHVLDHSRQAVSAWDARRSAPKYPVGTALICEALEAYFTKPEYRAFVVKAHTLVPMKKWAQSIMWWVDRAEAYRDRGRGRPRKVA